MVEGSRGTWLGFKAVRFRKRSCTATLWAVLLIRCAKPQPQSRAWAICSHGASDCPALPSSVHTADHSGVAVTAALPCMQTKVVFLFISSPSSPNTHWEKPDSMFGVHMDFYYHRFQAKVIIQRLCLFGNSVSLHLLWHNIFQLKYLRVWKNMCMF